MDFQNQLQMPSIYRVGDVFVLPSTGPGETWGLAMNEAMASGRAVIASNKCGGAIDLIEDKVNGIILDLKNNTALTELIDSALNNRQLVVEMGRQSLLKIQAFTFGSFTNAIEDFMIHKI